MRAGSGSDARFGKPGVDVPIEGTAAAVVDGQRFPDPGVRREPGDIRHALAEPAAAVAAKGNNDLAGKVVRFQQGGDRRGNGSPPVGVAQKYGVVSGEVVDAGGEFGPPSLLLVPPGLVQAGVVVAGIRGDRLDLHQIAPCLFVDAACDGARVAAPGEKDDEISVAGLSGEDVPTSLHQHGASNDRASGQHGFQKGTARSFHERVSFRTS